MNHMVSHTQNDELPQNDKLQPMVVPIAGTGRVQYMSSTSRDVYNTSKAKASKNHNQATLTALAGCTDMNESEIQGECFSLPPKPHTHTPIHSITAAPAAQPCCQPSSSSQQHHQSPCQLLLHHLPRMQVLPPNCLPQHYCWHLLPAPTALQLVLLLSYLHSLPRWLPLQPPLVPLLPQNRPQMAWWRQHWQRHCWLLPVLQTSWPPLLLDSPLLPPLVLPLLGLGLLGLPPAAAVAVVQGCRLLLPPQ